MKISEYRKLKGLNPAQFARLIGEKHPFNVSRWEAGTIPRRDTMLKIEEKTGGAITPNDFYAGAS